MERKLHFAHLGNGLTFWEEGDKEYKGHIGYKREVSLYGKFTPENEKRIRDYAKSSNTAVGNEQNQLALCPINPVEMAYTNPVTHEDLLISVEIVDAKEVLVCQGYIMKLSREKCRKL